MHPGGDSGGNGDRLVWSSERGDLRGERELATSGKVRVRASKRKGGRSAGAGAPPADGKIRVRREVKGRKGKGVTTVHGVPLAGDDLRELAAELKRRCGSGGSVRDAVIEIQGDHRKAIAELLEERGWSVVLAGG